MLIAVSGNVGSGKSTLARHIAKKYNFRYVPNKRLEFNFIDDFFNDIEGKFFPAQVSFLLSKAIEIQACGPNRNIIVDRSLLEDINVFAKLWIDNKNIDEKIAQLYQYTADFITSAIPAPDLYIVCQCPAEVCASRIKNRPVRKFEALYPPNHIQMLGEYYSDLTFEWGIPYVEIDTTYYDFTDEAVLNAVCERIFKRLEQHGQYEQLSLYDEVTGETPVEAADAKGMAFHNLEEMDYFASFKQPPKSTKYIYLAAPFTQLATNTKKQSSENEIENHSFFEEEELPYGELPSSYRNKLTKIEAAIKKQCGMPVLLPHRDINNWGKISHSAQYITPKIVETVENATALVAIPGNSIGVHMELGIAISRDIPIIVIETDDFQSSFFVKGLGEIPCVRHIKAKSISQIPARLENEKISEFIQSYGEGK